MVGFVRPRCCLVGFAGAVLIVERSWSYYGVGDVAAKPRRSHGGLGGGIAASVFGGAVDA